MKILVTGANGQLGSALRALKSGSPNYIWSSRSGSEGMLQLDIRDACALENVVTEHNIGIIINCAAYTNVDKAEDNAADAMELNGAAAGLLADVAARHNALLVHISTDYIFGAKPHSHPITEEAEETPSGVYGASKLDGERRIISSRCRHVIIRTSWLYSIWGKNFVKTILSLSTTKERLNVVSDQIGTPTFAPDLAEAIIRICRDYESEGASPQWKGYGIYNYSNEGLCSWYDFAVEIVSLSGNSCSVIPCKSSEFPSKVIRPAYSVLDKRKIKENFGIIIPHWKESLIKCIKILMETKTQI